jgi:hypothetical protein
MRSQIFFIDSPPLQAARSCARPPDVELDKYQLTSNGHWKSASWTKQYAGLRENLTWSLNATHRPHGATSSSIAIRIV